jgi:hypothetical protein
LFGRADIRKLATLLAIDCVLIALISAPGSAGDAHTHQHLHSAPRDLLAPLAADLEDGFPERHNGNGQKGSGGLAVAHYAGGIPIEGPAQASAPDARLYRLGINGWEPTMGVDSKGRIFYQARNSDLAPQVMRSTNSGDTWKKVSPMIAGAPAQPISLDPILHLDKDTDRVFTNNIPPDVTCQTLSFSDDAGGSWTNTAVCGHFDHQNIFSGPPPEGGDEPSGYPNVVYYCAINFGALAGSSAGSTCGRSLDGGLTWLHSGEPAFLTRTDQENDGLPWCDGAVGHGFVDERGTVYLPRVWCGEPYVAISHDEGFTWDQVKVSDMAGVAHEAGVAADSQGNIYYVWIADDRLPYLTISRDGGETWGEPMMIGRPGLKRASLAAIDIGADGKIATVYMGSTSSGKQDKWTWNGYITTTANALAARPTFYTGSVNTPKDPLTIKSCGTTRCATLGDFFDVTIGPDGTPWAAFVDGCKSANDCITEFENVGVRGEAIVGRLVGGPSLL